MKYRTHVENYKECKAGSYGKQMYQADSFWQNDHLVGIWAPISGKRRARRDVSSEPILSHTNEPLDPANMKCQGVQYATTYAWVGEGVWVLEGSREAHAALREGDPTLSWERLVELAGGVWYEHCKHCLVSSRRIF